MARVDADFSEFENFARNLRQLASEELAVPVAEGLAEVWVTVSQRRVPVDTGQTKARTAIRFVGGTAATANAEVVSDTPYAGYIDFGTRFMAPRPYWRAGRDAAVAAGKAAGAPLKTQIRRGLNSGGSMNPRQLIRAPA